MKVELLVSRYKREIGLARYAGSLQKYLSKAGVDYSLVEPAFPWPVRAAATLVRPLGYDIKEFANTFPLSAPFSRGTLKHFTTQMMAMLFSFQPDLQPVIVTVHDIVP